MTYEAFLLVQEDAVSHLVIALVYDCRRQQFARDNRNRVAQIECARIAEQMHGGVRGPQPVAQTDRWWREAKADYVKAQQEARAEYARMFSVLN